MKLITNRKYNANVKNSFDRFEVYFKLELSLEEKSLIDRFPELWEDELLTEYFEGYTLKELVKGVEVKPSEEYNIIDYIEGLFSLEDVLKNGCDEFNKILVELDMLSSDKKSSIEI